MKQMFITLMLMTALTAHAQTDSTAFRAHIYNKEYDVSMHLNFYDHDITVPQMDIFGQVPGYITNGNAVFCWIVLEADVLDDRTASMVIVNESGSEDLTASLTQVNDSTYTLRQLKGSTMKMLKGRKWQKLPSNMTFIRKK